ncbi:MAG: nitroreductase [Desulfarculaceae bacterium]|nr:nitroreductase [Desulfarculaceae bacterium]
MNPTELLELITSRRSVREYTGQPVDQAMLDAILEAGRWAPSGLNNQPWRFVVIQEEAIKEALAPMTKCSGIVRESAVLICTFLHLPSVYNEMKDYQGIGACLQNMLLMIHGLGLGAVWLGEILKNATQVRQTLGLGEEYELMAILALGHPAGDSHGKPYRLTMDELVLPARLSEPEPTL